VALRWTSGQAARLPDRVGGRASEGGPARHPGTNGAFLAAEPQFLASQAPVHGQSTARCTQGHWILTVAEAGYAPGIAAS
jgi:hypothetical protein